MKAIRQLILLLLLGLISSTGLQAQDDDEDLFENVPPRLMNQQEDYDEGEYLFPAQKKSNWSIGVAGGTSFVSGDVKALPGWGAAAEVRKALGHTFSIRAQVAVGQTRGLNYESSRGYYKHGGTPWDQFYTTPTTNPLNPTRVFYNFKMGYGDAFIQGVVNLNNINFYKEQNKWNIYATAGIGMMGYRVKVDALDANGNPYDFSVVPNLRELNTIFEFAEAKRNVITVLKDDVLDGVYETLAEGHRDEQGIKLGTDENGDAKYYVINPAVSAGMGFRFRIARRLDVSIEHRIVWTNDDLLDGQRWSEWPAGTTSTLTGDADLYHTSLVGLNFRLGPGEESMWWTNPLHDMNRKNADIKNELQKLKEDSDGDGIADLFDQEPDTPEDTPVDNLGRTLDSDADGYPDHIDDEPFSPKGSKVDDRGRALDADGDGVPDIFDVEPNTEPGYLVDVKGRAIKIPEIPDNLGGGGNGNNNNNNNLGYLSNCAFPSIHFDLDKDVIKPEFYPELYYIARVMRENPELQVMIDGHTDNRNTNNYNFDLSQRRAENTRKFLEQTFGISGSRIQVKYQGEEAPLVEGLPDNHSNPKYEPMHYINRRVEITCLD